MLFAHWAASWKDLCSFMESEIRMFCQKSWLWIDRVVWTTTSRFNTNSMILSKTNILYFRWWCLPTHDLILNKSDYALNLFLLDASSRENTHPLLLSFQRIQRLFRIESNRIDLFQFLVSLAANELYHPYSLVFLQLISKLFAKESFGDSHEQQWLHIFHS